jgi:hypothetical protein
MAQVVECLPSKLKALNSNLVLPIYLSIYLDMTF